MNKRLQREEVKQLCATHIGYNTCFVCGCTKAKGGMTIHHLEYIFNDVTYGLPKYKPVNDTTKLLYYKDLLPLVIERPERFMFLCNKHHNILEKLNQYNPKILVKLLEALMLTKTKDKYIGELEKLLTILMK